MGREPGAADWEQIVGRDLTPLLLPEGQQPAVYRPADVAWLPEGAHGALLEAVGGVGLEDLLVVPAVVWPIGWWWRRSRCLYSPRCVVGIGEHGVALWAQALPSPGVRVQVPFSEIAAVGQHGDGTRRVLVVAGRTVSLLVRYDTRGQDAVAAWTRRLRLRAGQPMP